MQAKPLPPSRMLALGVALAALSLTATDHFHAHVAYLEGLNTTRTLLPFQSLTTPRPGEPALTRRVTVIFLDGLRYQTAQELPTLSGLVAQGVQRPLEVELPSYTYPGVLAYATGVPPLYSGLRLNHAAHINHLADHVPLPSLLSEATQDSLPVRICSGDWPAFHTLLDPKGLIPEVSEAELLRPHEGRGLDWLYFGQIDEAGHSYGATSDEYQAAAQKADALVAKVLAATDLQKDTLLIVSDHGHLDRGGHGGDEEEVRQAFFLAVGAGVRQAGTLPAASYLDVTPTLSLLLGLSTPATSLGRPMLDVLALPEKKSAAYFLGPFSQRLELEEALTPAAIDSEARELILQLTAGDRQAVAAAERLLDRLAARRAAAYEAERDQRGWGRMLWAGSVTLLLLGVVFWLHRSGRLLLRLSDWVPTLAYSVVFLGLYYAAGYQLSWSLPRGSAGFLLETFFYGAAGVAVAFWLSHKTAPKERLTQETLVMVLSFGLPYLWVSAWVGLDPLYLGSPLMGFLVIFLATAGFYAHGPFGVYLLIRALRRSAT